MARFSCITVSFLSFLWFHPSTDVKRAINRHRQWTEHTCNCGINEEILWLLYEHEIEFSTYQPSHFRFVHLFYRHPSLEEDCIFNVQCINMKMPKKTFICAMGRTKNRLCNFQWTINSTQINLFITSLYFTAVHTISDAQYSSHLVLASLSPNWACWFDGE